MDMRQQRFGIEVELTGAVRKRGTEIITAHFGTQSYYAGAYYDVYAMLDPQDREWKFMSDSSVKPERKEGKNRVGTSDNSQAEMVSPICRYGDIETTQELMRKLREVGALADSSCGIHMHIDASSFGAKTLHNITNVMAAKKDLVYKALQVSMTRQNRWCKPVEERFLEELSWKKPGTLEEVRQIWYNGASRQREHYNNSCCRCLNLHSVFRKGAIEFRLFNGTTHAGKIKAYIQLCLTIGAQALNQTSASQRKTQTANEKHTFRAWLLQLGLNGDEFKTARLHLLKRLDGCIIWKDPAQAEAQKERLRMKREKELQVQERRVPAVESEARGQEETMCVEAEAQSPAFFVMIRM